MDGLLKKQSEELELYQDDEVIGMQSLSHITYYILLMGPCFVTSIAAKILSVHCLEILEQLLAPRAKTKLIQKYPGPQRVND